MQNKNRVYDPKPVNTDGIELTEDILELCEQLAENTHDVWAVTRINDGWVYGEERNDDLKLHPCLVPYGELPESEKEYDRKTSIETLKLIIKLGYRITKD